jgi:hypothetical protein
MAASSYDAFVLGMVKIQILYFFHILSIQLSAIYAVGKTHPAMLDCHPTGGCLDNRHDRKGSKGRTAPDMFEQSEAPSDSGILHSSRR